MATNPIRRKVKARRGISIPLHERLTSAWDDWSQVMLSPSATAKDEIEGNADRLRSLALLFSEEGATQMFLDEGYARQLLTRIKENQEDRQVLATLLFTLSDCIDGDETGALANFYFGEGLFKSLLAFLKTPALVVKPQATLVELEFAKATSRLKDAALCCLTAMSYHCMSQVLIPLDQDASFMVEELAARLQNKSAAPMHPRCVTFANNLFVSGSPKYHGPIATRVLPVVLKLILYNVTNHIKLKKRNVMAAQAAAQQTFEAPHIQAQLKKSLIRHQIEKLVAANGQYAQSQANQQLEHHLQRPHSPKPEETVDPLFDERFYTEFMATSCNFLGNLTNNVDTCRIADSCSAIDILSILFQNNADHSLGLLSSIIKSLANMSNLKERRPKILETNILIIAAKLHIIAHEFDELKAQLTLLIANLSGTPPTNKILIDSGVIPSLVDFLLRTNSESYLRFITLALANISLDFTAIPILVARPGCIAKCIDLCYSTVLFLQRNAVKCIYSIAAYPGGDYLQELQFARAEAGLLHVVAKLSSTATNSTSTGITSTESPPNGTTASGPSSVAEQHFSDPPIALKPTTEEIALTALALLQGTIKPPPAVAAPVVPLVTPPAPEMAIEAPEAKPAESAEGVTTNAFGVVTPTGAAAANGTLTIKGMMLSPIQGVLRKSLPPLDPAKSNECKERGNEFFRQRKYKEAILCYTKAAEHNPTDHTLYSNRSAAYTNLEQYELALKDSERCIESAPDWVKGYFRKGKALFGLQQFVEAIDSLQHALSIEKNNREIQEALKMAQAKLKEPKAPNSATSAAFGIPRLVEK